MKQLLTILRPEQRIPGFLVTSRLVAITVMLITSQLVFANIQLDVGKEADSTVVASGASVTYTYSIPILKTNGSGSDGGVKPVRLVDTFSLKAAIDSIVEVYGEGGDWDGGSSPV